MVLFFNLLCMQLIDRFRVSFFSIHSAVLSTGIINIIRYCFFKLNILFGHFGRFSCSVCGGCGGCGSRSAQQKFEFWTMKISVLLVFFQYTQCTGCGHPVCILKMQKKKKIITLPLWHGIAIVYLTVCSNTHTNTAITCVMCVLGHQTCFVGQYLVQLYTS